MPRRRPGRLRAENHPRARPGQKKRSAIDGLSSKTMAEIRRVEHRHPQLWPGIIGEAFPKWERYARDPRRPPWDDHLYPGSWYCCWECCGSPMMAKEFLDLLAHAMRNRPARELRARLRRLDELHGVPFP
ncbi:hypothetical protein HFP72_03535 [Nocardiopsis sp. ARC36]